MRVVGPSVWKIFEYVLNDLDNIFRLYSILETHISFRHSYLIRILIYTRFFFILILFILFLKE